MIAEVVIVHPLEPVGWAILFVSAAVLLLQLRRMGHDDEYRPSHLMALGRVCGVDLGERWHEVDELRWEIARLDLERRHGPRLYDWASMPELDACCDESMTLRERAINPSMPVSTRAQRFHGLET